MLATVENRLTSLVRNLRKRLEERIAANPTPSVIKDMGSCLDLANILEQDETEQEKGERLRILRRLLKKAKCEEVDEMLMEYEEFKTRLNDIMNPEGAYSEVVTRFQHLLFKTHSCDSNCVKVLPESAKGRGPGARIKVCPQEGTVLEPRQPNLMRILHLFYKEPSLYSGIKGFLHFYLR